MGELLRPERVQVMLTAEELRAVDDWRFRRRMPSRASAIREILRLGLIGQGVNLAEAGDRSRDFGVLSSPARSKSS